MSSFNSYTFTKDDSQRIFLFDELNKKNRQINVLNEKIQLLLEENKRLLGQINTLKQHNYSLNKIFEQNNNKNYKDSLIKENQFMLIIQKLQEENDLLKMKLNEKQKIEEKYQNTIDNKLKTTSIQLQNLLIMNINKDNIIIDLQNFLNNINVKINKDKNRYVFDLNKIDYKLFSSNLKKLEEDIINKFNDFNISQISKETNISQVNFKKIKNKNKKNIVKKKNTIPNMNSRTKNTSISTNKNKSFNHSKQKLSNRSTEVKILNDINCKTCKKLNKINDRYYREQRGLKMKGYLMTKQEGGTYRTPPRDRDNSFDSNNN